MNINNWSGKKKIIAILGGILAIVGIVVTIFLVQKQQEIRSHAEKSTNLSLSAQKQTLAVGEIADFDVVVNPGTNQVNLVTMTINFDPAVFSADQNSFEIDPSSNLSVVQQGPSVGDGVFSVTLTVGNDPTKVIQTIQRLGTLHLNAKSNAPTGSSTVSFDDQGTIVRSVGLGDGFNENVLSSTTPSTVTITGGVCKPNIATCSWDKADGATSYHYEIRHFAPNQAAPTPTPMVGDTQDTKVEFPSVPGYSYSCEVTANNECGSAEPSNGSSTCPLPTTTPSPSPSPSVSPTPSPSLSPTLSPTESPTPAPTDSPAPTEIITPSPTTVIVATEAPSQPIGGPTVSASPSPTLPPTGNPLIMGGIFGGILFILGGLALLLL